MDSWLLFGWMTEWTDERGWIDDPYLFLLIKVAEGKNKHRHFSVIISPPKHSGSLDKQGVLIRAFFFIY